MYIVTGGAGFIGSAMVWRLNKAGINDILVVDNLGTSDKWKNLVNRKYKEYIHRSQFLDALYRGHFSNIEGIIHMGACSSTTEKDADFLMSNNTQFSKKLCQYAIDNNIRFINASSAATYGDGSIGFSDSLDIIRKLKPLNMYGYSKHLFDLWLLDTGYIDRVASLKFFNVYGPNEYHKGNMRSVICKAFYEIKNTGKFELFKSNHKDYADGGQMRDFIYVKDCVNIIFWLLEKYNINGIFNIGTGNPRTWNDLIKIVFNTINLSPYIKYIDIPHTLKSSYQNFTQADISWMNFTECPIKLTRLEDGIKDYIHTYLNDSDIFLKN